jgi:hypothetical protein
MNFKLWLIEAEVTDYDTMKNYAMHLAKEPNVNLDDVVTLFSFLKKNLKKFDPEVRVNAFSDYQPIISQVIQKLSTEDRAEADKLLHNMFDDDTFRVPMAVQGYTNPDFNVRELEDIMHVIMDRDYDPLIVDRFLHKYGDVYKFVNEELKKEFITWFQDKIKRVTHGNPKRLAEILRELFKKMEPED